MARYGLMRAPLPQEDMLSLEEPEEGRGLGWWVGGCRWQYAAEAVLEAGRGGRQQLVCREQRLRLAS